jgi:hypothetical protein
LERTGLSWQEWFQPKEQPTVLLIDEAQVLCRFGIEHPFWQKVKDLVDSKLNLNLSLERDQQL